MKKGSTLFLKFVICLIAIGALIWLIWFPQLEGRAANLVVFSLNNRINNRSRNAITAEQSHLF